MSEHTTLYRKWRPIDFSSVVGQNHVTDVLKYQVANGRTSHAYLFCGSRGTGKTTCAKILSKAINCLSPINGDPCGKCDACKMIEAGSDTDIIEMDAASNNGVDYIRDIRDEVVYTPAFLTKKVYIIDEVHMLSSGAFNALLKTLEEPPTHVVFILATTELQKLPATITSRCQRFDFKRISTDDIASRLEYIASKENISVTHEAAKLIGRISQGGMRDAISLLELCSGTGKTVNTSLVNETAGIMGREKSALTVNAILKKDVQALFEIVGQIVSSSSDLSLFIGELIEFYRDMLVIKTVKDSASYLDLTNEEYTTTLELSERFTSERLLYHIRYLENTYNSMYRGTGIKRVSAELALVSLTDDRLQSTSDALLSRIATLEEKLASGNIINASIPKPASLNTDAAATTPKEAKQESSIQAENHFIPLPFWSEVVQDTERNSPWAAAHLKGTKAYWDGTNVTVIMTDAFSVSLVDDEATRTVIASSINLNDDNMSVNQSNIKFRVDVLPKEDDPFESLK